MQKVTYRFGDNLRRNIGQDVYLRFKAYSELIKLPYF